MSRMKKIKLFANAILQDFIDTNNDIEICKHTIGLIGNNDINKSLYTFLESDNYKNIKDEDWINEYFQEDFYFNFHIKKDTLYLLIQDIHEDNDLYKIFVQGNHPVSFEKSFLITLYYLSFGIEIYDLSKKFDLLPSVVLQITDAILKILAKMQHKYIIWPNQQTTHINSKRFNATYGYPGVLGVIDHTHVHFKPPRGNEELYRNKNMGYSIILQGIFNPEKEFINIFAGFPGSLDGSSILKHSLLYKEIEETIPANYFYNKYHLVANDSYPLRSWLMTPFRNNETATHQHIKHDKALQDTIKVATTTFALLKARWRILNFVNTSSADHVTEIIEACCVLHNFCIKCGDVFDETMKDIEREQMKNFKYLDVTREGERKRMKNLNAFI